MLVTPENPSTDPPVSPIKPVASHRSHADEGEYALEAEIQNLKEKELQSRLRAKRAKLEARLTDERKSQNSSKSCDSRDGDRRRRRLKKNVERRGSSIRGLSPNSRMHEGSVIDSRIDEEDWERGLQGSCPVEDVQGNPPLASQSLGEGETGASGPTPSLPTANDMQVEGHFGPGSVVQSMTPENIRWRSVGSDAAQGPVTNTQNIQVLNVTNAQPSAEAIAAVGQRGSATTAEVRTQTAFAVAAEAESCTSRRCSEWHQLSQNNAM